MPSSCDLLFRSPRYAAWETGTDSSILGVGGCPGAGKTFFAAAVYERLQNRGRKVAYFFCKSGSKDMGSTLPVLRTLLSQILKLERSAYGVIIPICQEKCKLSADSISEIENLFSELLASGLPMLHLIIDGVDELTDGLRLLQACLSFVCQSNTVIKILATSRNETDTAEFFTPYPSLQITSKMTRNPVERYLAKTLSECYTLVDPSLKRAILERVSYRADGLWLYAKLMIDAVIKLPSTAAVVYQLQMLPVGLSETYFQILEFHADELSSWQFQSAQQLFLWVDTEDYYWLRAEGKTPPIGTSILSVIIQAANVDGDSPSDPLGIAKVLGGPMMESLQSGNDGPASIGYVHLSARQYIMSASDVIPSSQIPRLLKPRRLRQLFRGHTALWYFGNSATSRTNLEIYRENPDAACDVWWGTPHPVIVYGLWDAVALAILPDGLDNEEITMAQLLCERLIQFLTTDACLVWVESAIIINYSGSWPDLLENAQKVLEVLMSSQVSNHQFFERYSQTRWDFFWHFAKVLAATGPTHTPIASNHFERKFGCSRFSVSTISLPVYQKISAIGEKYQYLVD
jgi:hypothetical protein